MTRTASIFDERVRADSTRVRLAQFRVEGAKAAAKSGSSGGKGKSREIVVRVMNKNKHPAAAAAVARYISRTATPEHKAEPRRQTDTPLETHEGKSLNSRKEIETELESWKLKGAEDNRSKLWRDADPAKRAEIDAAWKAGDAEWRRANYRQDPFARVQSAHIIISTPGGSADQLRAAVRTAAEGQFGGHRYMFAIHTDHGRGPHAHILLQTTHAKTGKSYRFDKRALEMLRHEFGAAARAQGIDVVVSRRVDRLAQEIVQGVEPLREHQKGGGRAAKLPDVYAAKAPKWAETYGAGFDERKTGAASPEPSKLRGYFQNFLKRPEPLEKSPAFQEVAKSFDGYADPAQATRSYLAMYAEAPKLAQWTLTKQPAAFGIVKEGEGGQMKKPPTRKAVAAALEAGGGAVKSGGKQQRRPPPSVGRKPARQERLPEIVAKSQERLADAAAQIGDTDTAAQAQARAQAIRSKAPIPAFTLSRPSAVRPTVTLSTPAPAQAPAEQKEKPMQTEVKPLTPKEKVERFQKVNAQIVALQKQMSAGSAPKGAGPALAKLHASRAGLASSIAGSPEAMEEAKKAGAAKGIEQIVGMMQQGLGLGPKL